MVRGALRLLTALVGQIALPGLVLLYALRIDRRDGRPDYVVPWIIFAGILWTAWNLPVGSPRPRRARVLLDIPSWVWPWVAVAGVLLYPR
jgi:hypothetical protein